MRLRLSAALLGVALAPLSAAVAQEVPPDNAPDVGPIDPEKVERRTQEIQDAATPSVVQVRATTTARNLIPRIRLPGLVLTSACPQSQQNVEATAFVVTSDGHIVTTCDAVRGADFFEIRFSDGTVRDAELLGLDEPFRVAVLRTSPRDGTRRLDDTADLEPGRRAVAWLLAAPDGAGQAPVQIAAVRAATRSDGVYDRYLTSHVSLLPGAAGGPLLSEQGRLLGMAVGMASNTPADLVPGAAKSCKSRSALFVRGEDVLRAVEQIAKLGRVRRARLGVMLDGDTPRVDQILPGGPAEQAGVREGDVVTHIGGVEVTTAQEIGRALLRRKPGESVKVALRRGRADVEQQIVLDDVDAAALPTTPPLAGATLEMAVSVAANAPPSGEAGRWVVRFIEIESGSAVERAGIQTGDELLSVDGMDVDRYLARHRIRAAEAPPSVLKIQHGGETRSVTLER